MPRISEMMSSKFLKKEDVGEDGILVTIAATSQENVAKEGADPEYKWCLHFEGLDKPLVLNSTNLKMLAKILESDNSDDWEGKKIVLYNDENVMFKGEIKGGIRVRASKQATEPKEIKQKSKLEPF